MTDIDYETHSNVPPPPVPTPVFVLPVPEPDEDFTSSNPFGSENPMLVPPTEEENPLVGKMLMTYDPMTGQPWATIEYPWPDGTVEAYEGQDFVITDRADTSTIYVNVETGECLERPTIPTPHDMVQPAGGSIVFTNLPEGSVIKIGEASYTVEDGTFEFTSDFSGTFNYEIECWPYLTAYGLMVFQ